MYLPNPFDLLPVIWEQMDEGKQDTTETLKQVLMAIIIIFLESRIWSLVNIANTVNIVSTKFAWTFINIEFLQCIFKIESIPKC